MFRLMHLGPEEESQKSQNPKKKEEAQSTKQPESAGSIFFGIDELKYPALDAMSINQLGLLADSAEKASNLNTSINVRILIIRRYEQNNNGNNMHFI